MYEILNIDVTKWWVKSWVNILDVTSFMLIYPNIINHKF